MDAFGDSNNYSIPVYFKDQANDLKNIEAEAKRALQNIKSLYEEIMHTDSYDNHELENTVVSSESPSTSTSTINKQQCTASANRYAEASRKFYFRPQLPLTHCLDCQDRYYETNNITSRSISIEEKFNFESEEHFSKESNALNSKSSNSPLKVTKPQPFKLSGFDKQRLEAKQQRLAKLKEEKEQQIEKELNIKVVAKPVPKHTHLPIYNNMVEKNEKRKTERKEESLRVIGRASKSSPLDNVPQTNVTFNTFSSESKTCFKATPVPKHILSNKVSERLKNKEEIHRMISAHRAEEMLKQSSSPLSKKTISRSYSMLDLNEYKKDDRDNRSKPNITAITNRLYTKKCKETMNNWNEKVTKYSYKENESKSNITILNKLKPQPKQSLPFLYYPVRMSTATSLRNKQIRSEILTREKREKHQNNEINDAKQEMHEEISKKLQELLPDINKDKEIEEKVKSFRESQINREEEYEYELEEIMKKVSQRCLLIERQSKKGSKKEDSLKGVTYEEENTSELNSDTDTKSDHLEEKESATEPEDSENSE